MIIPKCSDCKHFKNTYCTPLKSFKIMRDFKTQPICLMFERKLNIIEIINVYLRVTKLSMDKIIDINRREIFKVVNLGKPFHLINLERRLRPIYKMERVLELPADYTTKGNIYSVLNELIKYGILKELNNVFFKVKNIRKDKVKNIFHSEVLKNETSTKIKKLFKI